MLVARRRRHKRSGDIDLLREAGMVHGFEVQTLADVTDRGFRGDPRPFCPLFRYLEICFPADPGIATVGLRTHHGRDQLACGPPTEGTDKQKTRILQKRNAGSLR